MSLVIILSYLYLCWIHRDSIFAWHSDGSVIYTSETSFWDLFRCIWQQHTSEWHILDESRCIPLWLARVKTTTEIHLVAACFLWLISREEVASPPRISPRNSSPPPKNTSVLESCPEFRAHRFHPHHKITPWRECRIRKNGYLFIAPGRYIIGSRLG